MPHDPLGDDPDYDAANTLLVDLGRQVLANAAAELATIEHPRPE